MCTHLGLDGDKVSGVLLDLLQICLNYPKDDI